MSYTNINKSTDYFNTKLYTGNGSTNAITGVGFQPDFVWQKSRSNAEGHGLFDAVRGVTNRIQSNTGGASSSQAGSLTAFGSDGFTVGGSPNNDAANGNGQTFVSWNWKAGTGQGSSNTDGSINTTYTSASTTSGFSISLFTGTGSNATVGHGLGVAPDWVIVKGVNNTGSWTSYHNALGATKYMHLSETDTEATASSVWNSTAPTSSVFSVGPGVQSGSGNTYVAYCFAPIQGFSKFGKYIGNGNATTPPFIYTGFKPALVITKISSGSTNGWTVSDIKRDNAVGGNGNGIGARVLANASSTEETNNIWASIQKYSNGFSPQGTDAVTNANGSTYIYAAFAAAPLVGSNDIPANAR